MTRLGAALLLVALASIAHTSAQIRVETLRAVTSLPPHIVGTFEEPTSFQQSANGSYLVFDRRAHAVHAVDATRSESRKVVEVGREDGRIIQPTGFDSAPNGTFVVADLPRAQQRVQTFDGTGKRLTGFFLPGQPAARIIIDNLMLNGAGSVKHAGKTILIGYPETGALFTEYSPGGYPLQGVGTLRATGFESDRDLHIAMNAGLPLADPTGGYYYVFITGRPMFRKYDADGKLLFERHVEGRELDPILAEQPTRWPRRQVQDREVPFVTPVVRTAAVDGQGRLWISLVVPFTYVYDAQGDKTRVVQFTGAGTISPTSMFFTRAGRLLVTPGCYEFDPRG